VLVAVVGVFVRFVRRFTRAITFLPERICQWASLQEPTPSGGMTSSGQYLKIHLCCAHRTRQVSIQIHSIWP
jgi:hypothetical protein